MIRASIILGLLAVVIYALVARKKDAKLYKQEEADEDNGKYWDATEQGYRSKREKELDQVRKETYVEGATNIIKKEMMSFIYVENPSLVDLDSKAYSELNKLVTEHAQSLIKDVEKLKKKHKL
jgi:hypothetical protein